MRDIVSLPQAIREIEKLRKENKQLRSEVKTFKKAFERTQQFLQDYTGKFSIEQVIETVKNEETLEKRFRDKNENWTWN